MQGNYLSIDIKKQCILLSKQGKTAREIYNEYFLKVHTGQTFDSFRASLKKWKKKKYDDDVLLESANLGYNFTAHDSTVQINRKGEIIQAWIKQKADDEQKWNDLIQTIKDNTPPIIIEHKKILDGSRMLELPLFDMHFGVCDIKHYTPTMFEIQDIISRNNWNEINFIIGQDLLHNDDFSGRTTKGTQIEKIDTAKAWNDAKTFYYNIITTALQHCTNVNIIYSKGNHDMSMSWAFVQMLKEMFPSINFDDSLKARKCIYWQGCFIGIGHCEYKKSGANDLFKQFVLDFPEQFAKSTVREIHTGHVHHEGDKDLGIMVRRLSTGNITDDWSDDNGYVGAHKRFMLFEYAANKLKAMHYV